MHTVFKSRVVRSYSSFVAHYLNMCAYFNQPQTVCASFLALDWRNYAFMIERILIHQGRTKTKLRTKTVPLFSTLRYCLVSISDRSYKLHLLHFLVSSSFSRKFTLSSSTCVLLPNLPIEIRWDILSQKVCKAFLQSLSHRPFPPPFLTSTNSFPRSSFTWYRKKNPLSSLAL